MNIIINKLESTEYKLSEIKTVEEGTQVRYDLLVTNKLSKAKLKIYEASSSCGCTTPVYKRDPFGFDNSTEFYFVFDSKGRKGSNTKSVTLKIGEIDGDSLVSIKIIFEVKVV
jgi:hypothetical protein